MTELHCVQLRVVLLPSVYINTDQHDCGHPRKEEEEEAQKNNTNRRHYTHTHTHTPPSVYINTQQRRITGDTHKAVERLLTRTHTHTHTHTHTQSSFTRSASVLLRPPSLLLQA